MGKKRSKVWHLFEMQWIRLFNFPANVLQMLVLMFRKMHIALRRLRYPGSRAYWERRYVRGGDSGAGSSGQLAIYKAEVVNRFVQTNNIQTVIELGCGDGQQLLLAEYPAYTGLDISKTAVARCRALFAADGSKRFEIYEPSTFNPGDFQADMALSLEVIFHLTEHETYECYMRHLFAAARRWVVIFSSDEPDTTGGLFPHFKPRRFSPDVPPGWAFRERLPNPHRDISVSDFFIFEKIQQDF
jgi:SAM-dependent methyltransferase